MQEERIAIIDCGTNTFHLLIADYSRHNFRIVHEENSTVRIGMGGISYGKINEEAIGRALKTLGDFAEKIKYNEATSVKAFATSAFRSAGNRKEIIDRIFRETGIAVRVIDGNEEAELIYRGTQLALGNPEKPVLVIDIGGGSVEFIIGMGENILWKESFEIGGQRILDLFFTSDPVTGESVRELNEFLNVRLASLTEAVKNHKPEVLIGSSGSFETLSEMYMLENGITMDPDDKREFPFDSNAFEGLYQQLIIKDRDARLKIPGMMAMRVDMIVAAVILIKWFLDNFALNEIRVSGYALKEGVLARAMNEMERS